MNFFRATGAALAALIAAGLAVLLALAVGFMWVFGVGWFTDATANRQGETQKKQQIEGNGAYRIGAYDHFFDLCSSVQTLEDQIRVTQDQLKLDPDPDRKLQLQANLSAQQNQRFSAINQYNADARKSYTLGQFKASDLPFKLDKTNYNTECTV